MKLQRSMSTFGLLFSSISGLIGSGWLFGAYYAAQIAGPAAIFSWLIGGVLMMFIALTFAELATCFPVAGGTARFVNYSHGTLVNFTLSWTAWLASIAVAPIETLALIQYASNYLPWLMHKVNNQAMLTYPGILVAAMLMLSMCYLNSYGIKKVSLANSFIVIVKLAVPILTIVVFMTADFHWSNFHAAGGFTSEGLKGILSALPAAGVIFSFIGYSPAIQLAGEAKNPQRALPIAIMGSLFICIILYIFIQIVFIGALDSNSISSGWSHLSFAGDTGPFAGLAMLLGFGWLVKILYIDATISPYGTAFIYTTAAARLNFAMAKGGYLPKGLMKLNKRGVPMRSIMLNFIIGMLFFLPFPSWQLLVKFLVSAFVVAYAVGPIAVPSLRRSLPDRSRPFKLPAATLISCVAFYACNLIAFWAGWNTIYKVIITMLIGYIVFFIARYKATTKTQINWRASFWILPYLAGLSTISYLGSFGGGHNILPFGWDFLVIAIFSISIFFLAVKTALRQDEHKSYIADVETTTEDVLKSE